MLDVLQQKRIIDFAQPELVAAGVSCGMDVSALKLSELPNRLGELLDVTLEVQKKTNGEYTNVYLNKRIEIDVPPEHVTSREADDGSADVLPF